MSRLKSGLGAKKDKGAGRSASAAKVKGKAAGGRQVMVPKAKSDIYVALLGVSLGAMLIGMLLLALVLRRYDWQTKAVSNAPVVTMTALA